MPVDEVVGADLSTVDWCGTELSGRRFRECTFVDVDLSELVTSGCVFTECEFALVKLNVSVHTDTAFLRCSFRRTSFFGARLDGCKLTGSSFVECELRPL